MAIVQDPPGSALEMYVRIRQVYIDRDQAVRSTSAILLFCKALLQRPDPHPMRMYAFNNLAKGLVTRFDRLGHSEGLGEAISLACESDAVRPDVLGNASDNAQANADYTSQQNDSELIENEEDHQIREALSLLPAPHPDRSHSVASRWQLGNHKTPILHLFAKQLRWSRRHLTSSPSGPSSLSSNARVTLHMYDHTHNSSCLKSAVDSFRQQSTSPASASHRFTTACSWARCADAHTHASALEPYQHAIELLHRLATPAHTLQARQQIFASRSDGLARNVPAYTIR